MNSIQPPPSQNSEQPTPSLPPQRSLFRHLWTKIPRSVHIGAAILMLCLVSWVGYATSGQFLGAIDQKAQLIARKTVEQTAAAFLIAKSVNGAVSVASTFTVGAGALVNGSIEPGKVLDPFDRLIDDFSDYLLVAATAATLTELILVIDSSVGFSIIIPFCCFLGFLVYLLRHSRSGWKFHIGSLCQTVLAFVVLLRFGLPLVMIVSHQGYDVFLAPPYEQAQTRLNDIQNKTRAMYATITESKDHSEQWMISRWFDTASDKVDGVRAAAAVLRDNFDHFFDAIFTMTAVMALEILLLPVALGWIMWRLTRRITGALWYREIPA
ncbi:membrane hypothetical protein [Gammaproteobacteria bacterium]